MTSEAHPGAQGIAAHFFKLPGLRVMPGHGPAAVSGVVGSPKGAGQQASSACRAQILTSRQVLLSQHAPIIHGQLQKPASRAGLLCVWGKDSSAEFKYNFHCKDIVSLTFWSAMLKAPAYRAGPRAERARLPTPERPEDVQVARAPSSRRGIHSLNSPGSGIPALLLCASEARKLRRVETLT